MLRLCVTSHASPEPLPPVRTVAPPLVCDPAIPPWVRYPPPPAPAPGCCDAGMDYFFNPVTTACGHSFCKGCLTVHILKRFDKASASAPCITCRGVLKGRQCVPPVNITLRNLAHKLYPRELQQRTEAAAANAHVEVELNQLLDRIELRKEMISREGLAGSEPTAAQPDADPEARSRSQIPKPDPKTRSRSQIPKPDPEARSRTQIPNPDPEA